MDVPDLISPIRVLAVRDGIASAATSRGTAKHRRQTHEKRKFTGYFKAPYPRALPRLLRFFSHSHIDHQVQHHCIRHCGKVAHRRSLKTYVSSLFGRRYIRVMQGHSAFVVRHMQIEMIFKAMDINQYNATLWIGFSTRFFYRGLRLPGRRNDVNEQCDTEDAW